MWSVQRIARIACCAALPTTHHVYLLLPRSVDMMHVLIAENRADQRAILDRKLNELGCDVTVASEGQDIPRTLRSGKFQALIIGNSTPNAIKDTIRQIRTDDAFEAIRNMPVVVIADATDINEHLGDGIQSNKSVVQRPCTHGDIARALLHTTRY